MSHPLPATQHRRREQRIMLRLIKLLEVLEIVDRKAPLPPGLPARRGAR